MLTSSETTPQKPDQANSSATSAENGSLTKDGRTSKPTIGLCPYCETGTLGLYLGGPWDKEIHCSKCKQTWIPVKTVNVKL
jgi:hypothetical protein